MRPLATRGSAPAVWLSTLVLAGAPALAAPTDFSTLAGSRGEASTGATAAAPASADLFTGSATWELPIEVAPGTGGLQPALVLRYASQARSDSWVGYGWSLGPSSITRSLARGVPTYDDAEDVFLLDGGELVAVGQESQGTTLRTTYRTRVESFVDIVHEVDAVAGADRWIVRRKDGTALRYGTNVDSRVERGPGEVFQWLLSAQVDRHANAMTLTYETGLDPGTAYPSEVRYGLRENAGSIESVGADRVLRFVLEPDERPDVSSDYAAGFLRELRHRLDHVDVEISGAPTPKLLRRYDLLYAQSPDSFRTLLAAVARCGTDAETACQDSPFVTSFTYHSNVAAGTTGWEQAPWDWPSGAFGLVGADQEDLGVRLGDVDGDGRSDLVKAFGTNLLNGSPVTLSADSGVYLNTGSGFGPGRATSFDPFPTVPSTIPGNGPIPLSFALRFPSLGLTWGNGTLLSDLTGDGRSDSFGLVGFVPPGWDPTSQPLEQSLQGPWCTSAGDHFECATTFPDDYDLSPMPALFLAKQGTLASGALAHFSGNTSLGDLTGDGLPELIVRGRDRSGAPPIVPCFHGQSFSYVVYNRGGLVFEQAPTQVLTTGAAPALDGCGTELAYLSQDFEVCDLAVDADCPLKTFHSETWIGGFDTIADHQSNGNLVVDVNGDALADLLVSSLVADAGRTVSKAYLNDGALGLLATSGWSLPVAARAVFPSIIGQPSLDLSLRLADVNGDGRVDGVFAVGGSPVHVTWLNDGDVGQAGDPGAWLESPAWALPAGVSLVDMYGVDQGVRLLDVDGDGMTDLVSAFGSSRAVYLNRGSVPDLLVGIQHASGGATSIAYAPSTGFDNTGADGLPGLPQVVQVVVSITTDDARGHLDTTSFDYAGGLFDAAERRFLGFRSVSALRADGRETRTFHHQDPARAGLPERTLVLSVPPSGPRLCWAETRTGYTPAGPAPPWVSLPESRLRLEYDGAATWDPVAQGCDDSAAPARRSRTDFEYDAGGLVVLGNLTARIEYGEVDAAGADVLPDDTRRTEIEYAPPNTTLHLVDRVATERVRAGSGPGAPSVREMRFFYDGDTSGSVPPPIGDLTLRIEVLGQPGFPDPTTSFAYDAFGNLVATTHPRANAGELFEGEPVPGTSSVEYDPIYHTFPLVLENALGHPTRLAYLAPAECGFAHPQRVGLVHVLRGPNDLDESPLTGWTRCYDGFGRPLLERAPGDLAESTWLYDDTPGSVRVIHERRATEAGDLVREETWFDGLGRPVRTLSTGAGGRSVARDRSYDAAGRVATETAPYFCDATDPACPPEAGETLQLTAFGYDVLDRPVSVDRPGPGRVATSTYDRGSTTLTDPNGNVRRRISDPFGNVVRVEEDGPEGVVATEFGWSVLGRLERVEDAGGNVTQIVHDALGRRVWMWDPDSGNNLFVYDANGNRIEWENEAGSVRWTYDALDRRATETHVEGGVETLQATWEYDSGPGLENGIGRLFRRTDAAGTHTRLHYDLLGRLLQWKMNAAGRAHFFNLSYDPLGQVRTRSYPDSSVVESVRDAAGFVTELRDASGAPVYAREIEWDARGRLVAWEAGNGLASRNVYAAATGRLEETHLDDPSGSPLERLRYVFDEADRITAVEDLLSLLPDRSFGYDALDRLIEATGPYGALAQGQGAATLHYAYDALGNLVCRAAVSAPPGCSGGTQLVYPSPGPGVPRPHAPVAMDGQPLAYDSAGNLIRVGEASSPLRETAYDVAGRLVSAIAPGAGAFFAYDGDGHLARIDDASGERYLLAPDFEWNRSQSLGRLHVGLAGLNVATRETTYLPPGRRCGLGWELALVLPAALWGLRALRRSRARRRTRVLLALAVVPGLVLGGAALIPFSGSAPARAAGPANLLHYHADLLGSSVAVSDASGNLLQRAVYRPYGTLVPWTAADPAEPPEFGFTGQRHQPGAELYHFGARAYDPVLGRFLQPDAVVPDPFSTQSLNRYAYARNAPTNRVDPSGNFDLQGLFAGIGAFIGDVLRPFARFGSGFLDATRHSFGLSPAPTASDFFYRQGLGLGSILGAGVGVGLSGLAAPFEIAGDALRWIPGVGEGLARPFDAIGGREGLRGVAEGVLERADLFSRGNQRTIFGILGDDIGAGGTGLLAMATGASNGASGFLTGLTRLEPLTAGAGVFETLQSAVPRYGSTAGPAHGKDAAFVFNNANDILSAEHDTQYLNRDQLVRARADKDLANGLAGSVFNGSPPQPGPYGQAYRLGEIALFSVLGPAREAWVALTR